MQRGVEHDIRLLLIRENPLFLAPAHAVPHGQRFFRRGTAELIIAHDAAQQPRVGGADAVMIVQIQARQLRQVELADFARLKALVQFGIQTVDALDNQHLIMADAQRNGLFLAHAGGKVILGQLGGFAIQQGADAVPEQLDIQRVQRFQIGLAVLVQGHIRAV